LMEGVGVKKLYRRAKVFFAYGTKSGTNGVSPSHVMAELLQGWFRRLGIVIVQP